MTPTTFLGILHTWDNFFIWIGNFHPFGDALKLWGSALLSIAFARHGVKVTGLPEQKCKHIFQYLHWWISPDSLGHFFCKNHLLVQEGGAGGPPLVCSNQKVTSFTILSILRLTVLQVCSPLEPFSTAVLWPTFTRLLDILHLICS